MRNIFFVLLTLSICSCTYHWQTKDPINPVTYKDTLHWRGDSLGKLRRLALMPVEIKPYRGQYESVKDQEAAAFDYQEKCANFLTEKKGYEIVVIRETDGKWRGGLLENSGYDNIQEWYQEWHEETAGKHTAAVIKKIGYAINVDAVLVIQLIERKPWGAMGGILNIALMNIPLFYDMATPDIGVWIYETSTGRLVWREEYSTGVSSRNPDFGKTGYANALISLFADFENAVPRQLIK